MWIFLNDAMVSIVRDRTGYSFPCLLVRARRKADLTAFLPGAASRIKRTPKADYRFRCRATPEEVAAALAARLGALDYDNFKGSVQDNDRHIVYMRVWTAALALEAGAPGHPRPLAGSRPGTPMTEKMQALLARAPADWERIPAGVRGNTLDALERRGEIQTVGVRDVLGREWRRVQDWQRDFAERSLGAELSDAEDRYARLVDEWHRGDRD